MCKVQNCKRQFEKMNGVKNSGYYFQKGIDEITTNINLPAQTT